MTQVIFETAAFTDAVNKAARVAPTRGSAFDKSAGIVLEIQPGADYEAVVRATDTEVFYTEWLTPIHVEGDADIWRLPSQVFSDILNKLPTGSGKQVTLTRTPQGIGIQSGRARGHNVPNEVRPVSSVDTVRY